MFPWRWLAESESEIAADHDVFCVTPLNTCRNTLTHLPVLLLWNQLSLTSMCPVGLTDCIHILIQSSWHPGSPPLVEAFSLSAFSHGGSWILSMLFPSFPAGPQCWIAPCWTYCGQTGKLAIYLFVLKSSTALPPPPFLSASGIIFPKGLLSL